MRCCYLINKDVYEKFVDKAHSEGLTIKEATYLLVKNYVDGNLDIEDSE